MTEVKLSGSEIMTAAVIGIMRQIKNIRAGNTHLYGGDVKQGWQYHIEGALGECVVAKHCELYWFSGIKGGADVGEYQVRTTANHNNRLIIHPDDSDDARFYLVTGLNGAYRVQGWILGRDGKQEKYWSDPVGGRAAFFVPAGDLK